MSENPPDAPGHILSEHGTRYAVGIEGYPVAVILTVEEYNHYLDLLGGEVDNQDAILTARLMQTAAQSAHEEHQSIRDYLQQRGTTGFPGLKAHFDV